MSLVRGLPVLLFLGAVPFSFASNADFSGVWARDAACVRCETLPADLQNEFPCTDAEETESWRVFELRLSQVGQRLSGSYSAVSFRSDVIGSVDAQTLEDKTVRFCRAGRSASGDIVGVVRGNKADITFTNSWESGKFFAALRLRDNKLVWELKPRKGVRPGHVASFDVLHKTYQRADYVNPPRASRQFTMPK